jgi:RNA 2',3'-cyclic 3'-phosphodiesterase
LPATELDSRTGDTDGQRQPVAMRCFLAVPLAEPALSEARQLQTSLAERVNGVRWARPETLHLTVHFFGSIEDTRAASAVDVVAPVVSRTRTFEVTLGRLGAFPAHRLPRVLWLGPAHEVAPLTRLALECRHALRDAGFDVDARPYHPHCTLGRPRAPWPHEARMTWDAVVADSLSDTRFTAARLVLYESHTASDGAVYTERATLPLIAR